MYVGVIQVFTPGINMSQSSASSQELSLSATSFSPPEVITSLDTPLTRSSRKSRHPKSAASPQFAKLDKSTVLKFPVTSLAKDSKQATNEGLDSGADTSEMNVSMEVAKENGGHNYIYASSIKCQHGPTLYTYMYVHVWSYM